MSGDMQAAIFDGLHKPLRVGATARPEPGPKQVLLRIAACGICGSDLHMTEDPEFFGVKQGEVIGHEFAGEVIAVGAGVTGFAPGDVVAAAPLRGCGDCPACDRGEPAWCSEFSLIGGGYADYAVLDAYQCRKLPEGVAPSDGALAEPLAVTLHALRRSQMAKGARVAIIGAGPIGLLVAFWARRLGAEKVVVVDLTDHQKARAMELGATGFAVSRAGLKDDLAVLCDGPPEIVFECVGGPGMLDHAIDLVAPRGRVVGLGLCVAPDHMDSFRAISKEVEIIMSVFFTMGEFEAAIEALASETYRPQALISDKVSLPDMPAAFEALRRRTTQCKVLVEPSR